MDHHPEEAVKTKDTRVSLEPKFKGGKVWDRIPFGVYSIIFPWKKVVP